MPSTRVELSQDVIRGACLPIERMLVKRSKNGRFFEPVRRVCCEGAVKRSCR